jgi:hypothetical protein
MFPGTGPLRFQVSGVRIPDTDCWFLCPLDDNLAKIDIKSRLKAAPTEGSKVWERLLAAMKLCF